MSTNALFYALARIRDLRTQADWLTNTRTLSHRCALIEIELAINSATFNFVFNWRWSDACLYRSDVSTNFTHARERARERAREIVKRKHLVSIGCFFFVFAKKVQLTKHLILRISIIKKFKLLEWTVLSQMLGYLVFFIDAAAVAVCVATIILHLTKHVDLVNKEKKNLMIEFDRLHNYWFQFNMEFESSIQLKSKRFFPHSLKLLGLEMALILIFLKKWRWKKMVSLCMNFKAVRRAQKASVCTQYNQW